MAVNRSIGNYNSFCFRSIGGPGIIQPNVMAKIFLKNRSVKRANDLNVKLGSHLQQILYLRSVFSNDSDKISASFVIPIFFYIKSTEFSKSVCREKNLVCAVIGYHNFWPVHHWGKNKGQVVLSKAESTAIFYFKLLTLQVEVKEVADHIEGFCIGNNSCVWVNLKKICHIGCVIRFHVLYDQVIRFASVKSLIQIIQPFVCEISIYCIHNCNFLIKDYIRIVSHAVWHFVLSFKKVYLMIVYAYIFNGICDFHTLYLLFITGSC